ncbi:MAG TPA: ABC transporter substrate-binding protein [Elusimicrobiota bacterium]|jgi:sn-glycerol 3-phosphate transport system substrate-binding protein|nr:ABC transporter substrate-binding protein [Elusimicrobiota bacterium]
MKTLAAGLAALLLAAAPLRAAPVTLEFWHSMSGEKGELLQAIVDKFNASPENAGRVRVELQFVGSYEDGLNKLRTALLADRGPHLVQITDIGTRAMADSAAIVPLQDFIDRDPEFPLSKILLPIRRYYEIDGRLDSLPFATSGPILYCNADAFAAAGIKAPPRTFAELAADARRLTDPAKGTTGITWPLHSWFLEEFMARQGEPFANRGNGREGRATSVNLTSPAAFAVVSLWAGMVKEGTFANVGRGWEPAEQNFLAGRSAMLITSTSDVFEIRRKAPFRVMTGPLPAKDLKSPGGTVIGGNSIWIMKNKPEAEREAAYRFLKFMASKESQRAWHVGTGYFPIRGDVIDELEKEGFYKRNPDAKTAIDQLRASPDGAAERGALLGVFSEARENVESALELILAGYRTPQDALSWAKARTEDALARYDKAVSVTAK